MALSPEQEWTLIACGLIAHADDVLEIGEWDQVLVLLDERLDAAEAEPWLAVLADRSALQQRLDQLQPPPPFFSETILEKAWRMALADGLASAEELAAHDAIAQRLGVEPSEVEGWRSTWTTKAIARGELVARFAAFVGTVDGQMDPAEIDQFEALLERLPLDDERREALRAEIDDPPTQAEVVASLAGMEPQDRVIALQALAPLVHAAARGVKERAMFLDLADAVAVPRADAERMLENSP